MFIRFRKLKADGRRPEGVRASETIRWARRRRVGRWTITNDRVALTPYTLEVTLAENHRVDGKVRQEHIATLGAINAWLIPEFWAGLDEATIATLRTDEWDLLSVRARRHFWETAKPRLERLANRIGDIKPTRMAIHRRIPWPMEAERELVEAEHDLRFWQRFYKGSTKIIETNEELIERAKEQNVELRQQAMREANAAAEAAKRLKAIRGD